MFRELIRMSGCRNQNRKRNKGFTLTEAVVASGLLIIAIVPILKALTNVHFNSVTIGRKTQSLIFAQSKLDEIKAESIYNYDDTFAANNTPLYGGYLCNVMDNATNDDLRTITVSAGYDRNGDNILSSNEIEITLSTFLARRQ